MGTTAISIYPTWPAATTTAWLTQARALIALRVGYCGIKKLLTRYFAQSAAGNSSGGGGSGTLASPYLCKTRADLATLRSTFSGTGNLNFALKRGSVWRGYTGTFNLDTANTSASPYGQGDDPTISGFLLDTDATFSGSWAQDGSSRWNRDLGQAVYWLRNSADSYHSVLKAGSEVIWTKCAYLTAAEAAIALKVGTSFDEHDTANGPAFYLTGTTVYVKRASNTNPGGQVEYCGSSVSVLTLSNVDKLRVDSIICAGGSMNSGDNSAYVLRSDAASTNEHVLSNMSAFYGPLHTCAHLCTGAGNSGGIVTWLYLRHGAGLVSTGGIFISWVAFADQGAHEVINLWWTCPYGALPDTGSVGWSLTNRKRGVPCYIHTSSSDYTYTAALELIGMGTVNTHTYGAIDLGVSGGAKKYYDETVTNRAAALAECRSWWLANIHKGGSKVEPQFTNAYQCRLWEQFQNAILSTAHSTGGFYGDGGDGIGMNPPPIYNRGEIIGCLFEVDWTLETATVGALLRWTTVTHEMDLDHICCTFINKSAATWYMTFDARDTATNKTSRMRWFNCVWSTNLATGAAQADQTLNGAPTGTTSGADSTITGGQRNCAFFNANVTVSKSNNGNYQGYDATTSPVDLLAEPAANAVPVNGGQLYHTGTSTLPVTLEWWASSAQILYAVGATLNRGHVQDTTTKLTPLFARPAVPSVSGIAGNGSVLLQLLTAAVTRETRWRVYYGLASGIYTDYFEYTAPQFDFVETTVDGDVLHKSFGFAGLVNGSTYYFAATALDALGEESDYSTPELTLTPTADTPPVASSPSLHLLYGS